MRHSGRTGDQPERARVEPAGCGIAGTVWVANEDGHSLSVIDAATSTVVTTVEGIEGPHNVQVGADGNRVYAVSGHARTVAALDTGTYRLAGAAATGAGPSHVVLSADGQKTYVTNYDAGTVSVYRADLTPAGSITLGGGPHGLRPSPDGTTLVVANLKAATVDLIATGSGPHGVVVDPTGRRAWVTDVYDSTVSVIDLPTRATVATVKVGKQPNGISYAPRPAAPAAARMSVVLPTPSAASSGHDDHG